MLYIFRKNSYLVIGILFCLGFCVIVWLVLGLNPKLAKAAEYTYHGQSPLLCRKW